MVLTQDQKDELAYWNMKKVQADEQPAAPKPAEKQPEATPEPKPEQPAPAQAAAAAVDEHVAGGELHHLVNGKDGVTFCTDCNSKFARANNATELVKELINYPDHKKILDCPNCMNAIAGEGNWKKDKEGNITIQSKDKKTEAHKNEELPGRY